MEDIQEVMTMVDMQLIIYSAIGAAVLAAIALIGSNMSTIVSAISRASSYFVMSLAEQRARRSDGMQSVYIPVSQYGMDASGMEDADASAPDIDAGNTDMPRLSRNITDGEMIVLLAVQRGKDGKHRYSANAIHTLVGGDRNSVLAKVKAIRATPPPAEYMQPDGSRVPASHPITGQRRPA